jgi:subtilase family serine protease
MHNVLNLLDRRVPVPLTWLATSWQRLRCIAVGLSFLPIVSSQGTSATVNVSPLVAKSTLVSAVDGRNEINVVLSLPLSNPQGAAEFVQHVSTPSDPLYRHYLTPEQFAAQFGASATDYAALKEWATGNGLALVKESAGRTTLTVRGSVSQFQSLFRTQLNNYRSPDRQEFYSASVSPTVPDAIAGKVTAVVGLTNSKQYAALARAYRTLGESPADGVAVGTATPDTPGGSGPGGAYSAADLRKIYSIPSFGGFSKQSVAVFEQGGFTRSDVTTYLSKNRLPMPKISAVGVDGYDGKVNDPKVELEAVLDIDMVVAINPEVKEVLVYEDGNDPFPVALLDAITQVADDNLVQVLSISYGQDETLEGSDAMTAENSVFTQLSAEGITVTASAGDEGAYGDFSYHNGSFLNVPDPGSQPNVLCVGGTTLFTAPKAVYSGEQTWNELSAGFGATGGGVSAFWSIPSWQLLIPGAMTAHGGSSTYRNVPDVAAVADPLTGVAVYSKINGGWLQIGGTSVSAPIWAGYLSLLNSASIYAGLGQIGYFNPTLYDLGVSKFLSPTSYFYDVDYGSNGSTAVYPWPGYNSGSGYDNCTGWGSLYAGGLAFEVLSTSAQSGTAPSQIVNLQAKPTATKVKLSWDFTSGQTVYVVAISHLAYVRFNQQTFVTKDTKIEITGLTPADTSYSATVAAVNASGSSQTSVSFSTNAEQ